MVIPNDVRATAALLVLGLVLVAGTPDESARVSLDAPRTHAPDFLPDDPEAFLTSDRCIACHKGVTDPTGTDVSIGFDWRASMMANAARDPYWQAAVRREITDYPEAADAIEDKCSRCHMPMANEMERRGGASAGVFANLPIGQSDHPTAALAADGVSCAACHRIEPEGLGTEASYTGGFQVAVATTPEGPPLYGPFEPDAGGRGIMHSATGFVPTEASHIQSSQLCASCHTLFTHAVRPAGETGPEFAEQAPYLEWQASRFAQEGTSCQDCHMPEVAAEVPVTRVLGRDRANVSRHVFRGGNFFMLRMLSRYRDELGVAALPQELALSAVRTEEHLREATVRLNVDTPARAQGRIEVAVSVENLAGHKFPTAYPSRRAWLHVEVTDAAGRTVFESGALRPDGSIVGNDGDAASGTFEPHYDRITSPDQVQIYEAVMVDRAGAPTTGLMSAEGWAKDNRLQPQGFSADAGDARVSTKGAAASDPDFGPGTDRVRYAIEVDESAGPFQVHTRLFFQPIGYRWAENLADYSSMETDRFVRYYRSMSDVSGLVLAEEQRTVR